MQRSRGGINSAVLERVEHWDCRVPQSWSDPKWRHRVQPLGIMYERVSSWDISESYAPGDGPLDYYQTQLIACGWPFLTFEARDYLHATLRRGDQPSNVSIGRWRAGIVPPAWLIRKWKVVPLGVNVPVFPSLPGFVANSVLYGGIAMGVLIAPGTARRASRRNQRRCVWCGYQLAGLVKCPECGSEVAALRRRG